MITGIIGAHGQCDFSTYNTVLAAVKTNLNQRAAEKSYGLADEERTPALGCSGYSLRAIWVQLRDEAEPAAGSKQHLKAAVRPDQRLAPLLRRLWCVLTFGGCQTKRESFNIEPHSEMAGVSQLG